MAPKAVGRVRLGNETLELTWTLENGVEVKDYDLEAERLAYELTGVSTPALDFFEAFYQDDLVFHGYPYRTSDESVFIATMDEFEGKDLLNLDEDSIGEAILAQLPVGLPGSFINQAAALVMLNVVVTRCSDEEIREKIAIAVSPTERTQREVCKDESSWVRSALAANPKASPSVLTLLASDVITYVRTAVLENPRCPAEAIVAWSQNPDVANSGAFADKINEVGAMARKLLDAGLMGSDLNAVSEVR